MNYLLIEHNCDFTKVKSFTKIKTFVSHICILLLKILLISIAVETLKLRIFLFTFIFMAIEGNSIFFRKQMTKTVLTVATHVCVFYLEATHNTTQKLIPEAIGLVRQ